MLALRLSRIRTSQFACYSCANHCGLSRLSFSVLVNQTLLSVTFICIIILIIIIIAFMGCERVGFYIVQDLRIFSLAYFHSNTIVLEAHRITVKLTNNFYSRHQSINGLIGPPITVTSALRTNELKCW